MQQTHPGFVSTLSSSSGAGTIKKTTRLNTISFYRKNYAFCEKKPRRNRFAAPILANSLNQRRTISADGEGIAVTCHIFALELHADQICGQIPRSKFNAPNTPAVSGVIFIVIITSIHIFHATWYPITWTVRLNGRSTTLLWRLVITIHKQHTLYYLKLG